MTRTHWTGAGLILAGLTGACSRGDRADTRLEHPAARASESALARSRIPGASAVGKALQLSDSADARRRREDSIFREIP